MDKMDKRIIFNPLPDSKEAELKKSMPQLSSIVDKIDELHTRSYSSHVYSKKEERQLRIIIYYMELVSVPKNQTYEWALIHYILPKLSITPFHFEGNIFYVIQGLDEAQRTTPHPIFSEADIYSFFKSYYFSTPLPPPNEKQLTARSTTLLPIIKKLHLYTRISYKHLERFPMLLLGTIKQSNKEATLLGIHHMYR